MGGRGYVHADLHGLERGQDRQEGQAQGRNQGQDECRSSAGFGGGGKGARARAGEAQLSPFRRLLYFQETNRGGR